MRCDFAYHGKILEAVFRFACGYSEAGKKRMSSLKIILINHGVDYLLTWNCRHIDNATRKTIIRAICVSAGYFYPEICTPMELLTEDSNDVL